MSIETGYDRIEIHSSILNLMERSTVWSVALPMDRLDDINREAGYAGFEWHPLNPTTVVGLQVKTDALRPHEQDAITSVHQSFRSERNVFDIARSGSPLFSAAATVLLEHTDRSISSLIRLQEQLARPLPLVFYPRNPQKFNVERLPFSYKMIQPKPVYMRMLAASSPGEFLRKMMTLKYDFCLDTHHFRQVPADGRKPDFQPWNEYFPYLLPYAKEIHVAAGRWDKSYPGVDTQRELQELIAGRGDSPLMQMLRMIQTYGWKGPIVTEIPSTALHAIRPDGLFLTADEYIRYHKQIVQTIGSIVG